MDKITISFDDLPEFPPPQVESVNKITISFDELGIRDLPSIRAFAHCVRVTCKTYPKSEYFHLESRTPPTRWVYGSFGAATNVGIVELSVNLTPLIVRRTISSPE